MINYVSLSTILNIVFLNANIIIRYAITPNSRIVTEVSKAYAISNIVVDGVAINVEGSIPTKRQPTRIIIIRLAVYAIVRNIVTSYRNIEAVVNCNATTRVISN